MDADKRHQLKQNELAEALAKLRNLNDPRLRWAVAGLAVVAVIVLGWFVWQYNRRHTLEQSWQRLTAAAASLRSNDAGRVAAAAEDLRSMIRETTDPGLGGYARLQLAAVLGKQAYEQPAQRAADFEEARKLLEEVRGNPQTPAMLEAAASFALASTCESLRQFDQAKELYTALADQPSYESFAYKSLAAKRLAKLSELTAAVTFVKGDPPAPEPPVTEAAAVPVLPTDVDPAALIDRLLAEPAAQPPPTTQPAEPAPAARAPATPESGPSPAP